MVRIKKRSQHFLYLRTESTTTPMSDNRQSYKWQPENLEVPLMEWCFLVSDGDKAFLWHELLLCLQNRTKCCSSVLLLAHFIFLSYQLRN